MVRVTSTIEELLTEYFKLKDEDKAIRTERNAFMDNHVCQNPDRSQLGDCIHQEEGMGGYPAPLCEVCEKRNGWYERRQVISHKRSAIMQRLKRMIANEA